MAKQLKDFDILLYSMDSFIRANGNFESSIVINSAITELEQCESMQQCFSVPLQHKLFNMESSLKWVLFMVTIPEKIIEQESEDEEFKLILDEFKLFTEFSSNDELKLIATVYDIGLQDTILTHIEDDEDDEEDDEDEEGDDEDDESYDDEDDEDDDEDDDESDDDDESGESEESDKNITNDNLFQNEIDLLDNDIKSLSVKKTKKNK